ncbi:class I adenylate-forming enzyme family protein [Mammaliicoccus sciuri]|uniref:Acyl-CoA synthetase (AMP-forming)/AMP-acid ligase II n=1 Tax=Sporosarcina newyorkensis TaxID=759851 RepID=A0A1T4Y850_9BACL|nr:class I adenylate-forming enzyme family protein [Sporosarcina newyorkensis]SKA97853.1 Acyl-CoA synthetase (AMP-forming)/AMP-acid ligase II [Sporosarcina newyorkensis]
MILADQKKIDEYTAKGFWGTETLYELFLRNVKNKPESLAAADPLNREAICSGVPQQYTYEELLERVETLSIYLLKNGIRKDDIIGIQLPNTVEMLLTYLAILRIGAIATPFPVQYRKHEYRTLLNFTEAKAIITMTNILKHHAAQDFVEVKPEVSSLEHIFAWGDNVPEGVISLNNLNMSEKDRQKAEEICTATKNTANDVFTICWTSGTEGTPKGVPRTHNEWIISSYASVDAAAFTEEEVLLNTFPMVNMAGIAGMFVPWLLTNCTLIMHHPFDLPTFLRQIASARATYTLAPPALLNAMLNNEEILKNADFSSLRAIGSGSTPLSPWMVKGWQDKFDISIINYFGSNEGATFISDPRDIPDPEQRANYFPRLGVKGLEWTTRIAHYFESKLVDVKTGSVITESGIPGEMRIKGASVFPGYWGQEDAQNEFFDEEGYFRTGDLFEIIEKEGEQKFYRFVGRTKEIIIRGGVNISPAEVEYLLQTHPKVAEVSIVGLPDKRMGEKACACIVLKDPGSLLTIEEIIQYFKDHDYAIYKIPEYVYFLDELPRNPVGKILKYHLKQQVLNSPEDVKLEV